MIDYLIYFLLGFAWAEWLEWFCMNNLSGDLAKPFRPIEKFLQIIIWPVFLLVFVYNFLEDVFRK